MGRGIGILLVVLLGIAGGRVAAEEEAPAPPPPGTLRFSPQSDAFPVGGPEAYGPDGRVYALANLGKPWKELMKRARKDTSAVVRLFVGNEQKGTAAFYPGLEAFERDLFVIEVLPDPETATQFLFGLPRGLAQLPPGRHDVRVQLWSFDATTPENVLAEGTFAFVATEEGKQQLADLEQALRAAKVRRTEAQPKPEAKPESRTTVRRGGSDLLYLRGDEVVLEGAVVGRFEGDKFRKGGSIVGEIRGTLYRHEGADAWSLDRGNLFPGREIRYQGAIIGDVRSDGGIWKDGSDWGSVKPYGATDPETMRVVVALFYFADFFP
jgi:hypothetical protein